MLSEKTKAAMAVYVAAQREAVAKGARMPSGAQVAATVLSARLHLNITDSSC